jgi:DNA-binding response OmpR family regulator
MFNLGLKKKNIVLIEDDEILSLVMQEELSKAGFTVFVASDGEAGLKLVQSKKPDLVLLDLVLTKKSGYDVLKVLKESPDTKDIQVVIMSVLSGGDDIQKAMGLGAHDYIVKSQHAINEIVDKIKTYG